MGGEGGGAPPTINAETSARPALPPPAARPQAGASERAAAEGDEVPRTGRLAPSPSLQAGSPARSTSACLGRVEGRGGEGRRARGGADAAPLCAVARPTAAAFVAAERLGVQRRSAEATPAAAARHNKTAPSALHPPRPPKPSTTIAHPPAVSPPPTPPFSLQRYDPKRADEAAVISSFERARGRTRASSRSRSPTPAPAAPTPPPRPHRSLCLCLVLYSHSPPCLAWTRASLLRLPLPFLLFRPPFSLSLSAAPRIQQRHPRMDGSREPSPLAPASPAGSADALASGKLALSAPDQPSKRSGDLASVVAAAPPADASAPRSAPGEFSELDEVSDAVSARGRAAPRAREAGARICYCAALAVMRRRRAGARDARPVNPPPPRTPTPPSPWHMAHKADVPPPPPLPPPFTRRPKREPTPLPGLPFVLLQGASFFVPTAAQRAA